MDSNMIVTSARFDPFSYQDMMAPVAMADTEHKAIQDDEGKLETLADAWKGRLDPIKDPVAYKQYSDYLDNLKQQSSALASSGLTPTSRQSLVDLKSGYSSNIAPIEEAYTNRQKGVAFQNELRARDNSVVFNKDFSNTSIDDFMKNPTLTSQYASGAAVLQQVANQSKEFADRTIQDPNIKKLGHGFLNIVTQMGVDPNTIQQVLNSPDADPNLKGIALQLKNIRDNAIANSGVTQWGTPDAVNKIKGFANQGLYAALGKTENRPEADWLLRFNMEEAAKIKAAKALQAPSGESGSLPFTSSYYNINTPIAKQISGIKSKLFDANGVPLSTAFSRNGNINPVAQYESVMDYNKNIDKQIAAVSAKYKSMPTGSSYNDMMKNPQRYSEADYDQRGIDVHHKEVSRLMAMKKPTVLSTDDYNNLKSYGITTKDNWRDVKNKIGFTEQHAQTRHTSYGFGLSDYKGADNLITQAVTSDNKSLTPIGDASEGYKLHTDKTVSLSDLEKNRVNPEKSKPLITDIKYSPLFNGLVVTTQSGKEYKINHVVSDDYTKTIQDGDKLVQSYIQQGRLDLAKKASLQLRDGLLQVVSHGLNQVAGDTNKDPYSPIGR
jgi:hypothetical protein